MLSPGTGASWCDDEKKEDSKDPNKQKDEEKRKKKKTDAMNRLEEEGCWRDKDDSSSPIPPDVALDNIMRKTVLPLINVRDHPGPKGGRPLDVKKIGVAYTTVHPDWVAPTKGVNPTLGALPIELIIWREK